MSSWKQLKAFDGQERLHKRLTINSQYATQHSLTRDEIIAAGALLKLSQDHSSPASDFKPIQILMQMELQATKKDKRKTTVLSHTKHRRVKDASFTTSSQIHRTSGNSEGYNTIRGGRIEMSPSENYVNNDQLQSIRSMDARALPKKRIEGYPSPYEKVPWGVSDEDLIQYFPNHLYGDCLERLIRNGWNVHDIVRLAGGNGAVTLSTLKQRMNRIRRQRGVSKYEPLST